MAKEVRFGVSSSDGNVSPYFKVRTSARGDVYAVSEAMHQSLHISLHESPDHWHVKVSTPRGIEKKPIVPLEVGPSTRRALTVTVPGLAATYPKPDKKVVWVRRDEDDPRLGVAFNFLVQRPENGSILDWPAQGIEGITLVGRLPLGDFGTLTVTALHRPMPPLTLGVDLSAFDDLEAARQRLVEDFTDPDAFVLLWLTPKDGGTEFISAPGSMFRMGPDASVPG